MISQMIERRSYFLGCHLKGRSPCTDVGHVDAHKVGHGGGCLVLGAFKGVAKAGHVAAK